MSIALKVVQIGNSKGVRLPAEILRRYHLSGEVLLEERPDGIFLRSSTPQKLSFAEAAAEMLRDSEDKKEFAAWENAGLDGLQDEGFQGWQR